MTTALANPRSTGGIVVLLQQPRDNHPFDEGVEAVKEDCETLRALEQVFFMVSGGKLDLIHNISVIDLLPYISPKDWENMYNEADEEAVASAFKTAQWAIAAKEPDVVLCAGKKSLPTELRHLKGDMWRLESKAVGVNLEKYPSTTVRNREGRWIRIRLVNGFHPSHAVNYNAESSCLRQLLFLVVAQTCAVYGMGSWKEEAWMADIRQRCSEVSRNSMLG